jgi:hypothetical protein
MATKNDITGDSIASKHKNQKLYEKNWDKIFGKKLNREVKPKKQKK